MSMRDKLLAAARVAAIEERARCLWCADEVVRELTVKLSKKILTSTAEEQLAKVKLQIAKAVVIELRRAIVSGVRPAKPPCEVGETGQTDTAGFSLTPPAAGGGIDV
jgi:hypothetical protein